MPLFEGGIRLPPSRAARDGRQDRHGLATADSSANCKPPTKRTHPEPFPWNPFMDPNVPPVNRDGFYYTGALSPGRLPTKIVPRQSATGVMYL
jgi:hypothetical protein